MQIIETPIFIPTMLMIGGSTRNVGKTSLSCKIIEHFSKQISIIGLKIKTIRENDSYFHGLEKKKLLGRFNIDEETDFEGIEDTSKMLRAGAKRVFRIKSKKEFLFDMFKELIQIVPINSVFICESNSLREFIKPGIFIIIKEHGTMEMKPSARELEKFADKIIFTDGNNHNFDFKTLKFESSIWKL